MAKIVMDSIIGTFGSNPLLATFIVALLPIFELRGAIPFGMSTQIWGTQALSAIQSFLISFFASLIVIPVVAVVFVPLLNFLKTTKLFKNISQNVFNHFLLKANLLNKNNSSHTLKILGVMGFVAIPLPLTGVYTGTVIAVLLGLNFYETLIACGCGNLIAGVIVTLLATVLKDNTIYLLYVFLGLLVVTLIIAIIKKLIKKQNKT